MNRSNLNASLNFAAPTTRQGTAHNSLQHSAADEKSNARLAANQHTGELSMWLQALCSFFDVRTHPLTATEQTQISTRDFTDETRIAQQALRRSMHLVVEQIYVERAISPLEEEITGEGRKEPPAATTDFAVIRRSDNSGGDGGGGTATSSVSPAAADWAEHDLILLREVLADACAVCDGLLEGRAVSWQAWVSVGRVLRRELSHAAAMQRLMRTENLQSATSLHPKLVELSEHLNPDELSADVLKIFSNLAKLLDWLRFVETLLSRDCPLKQTLPVFTLVRREARELLDFIELCMLATRQKYDASIIEIIDSTAYAISMELRKVFAHELTGLSGLRQPPAIYAKIENAHGLLRDCFQQSTVALAQSFDPTLDGAALFSVFHTKLGQSLALRHDLWNLLQVVRDTEKGQPDRQSVTPLLDHLTTFRNSSLRHLMYKDWESYERFVEEIAAARGTGEVALVLHRFGMYLETLLRQINMRAVLVAHPFVEPTGRR